MFHRKSKAEKAREEATSRARRARKSAAAAKTRAAKEAQHGTDSMRHAVRERLVPRAEAAAGSVGAHAAEYRHRAVSGLDHGIDAAVPRVEQAVAGVGPKVDHARDLIVDDLLPKLSALVASVQASKDDLLAKQDGPVAAVTGAPKRRRKGGVLLALGVLAAVGAGVAWYLGQQSRDQRDPWAALPEERPIGGAPGVDSQVRQNLGTEAAAGASTGAGAGTSGTTGATAAAGGTVVGGAAAVGTDSDQGTADVEPPSPTTDVTTGTADAPVDMLDSEDIDAMAAGRPEESDDLPGSNTDETTGFGTEEPEDRQG